MNQMNIPLSDWQWLVSDEATELLENPTLAALETFRLLVVLREKFGLTADRASLVAMQFACRQRAGKSFTQAKRMFFNPTSLEQATDEWTATYKAARFPAGVPVADVCCGIGGDLMALAQRGPVLGVDCDEAVVQLARKNLELVETNLLETNLLETNSPEKKPSEENSLEKNSLKENSLEKNLPEKNPPEKNLPQVVPTGEHLKTSPESHSVQAMSAETFLQKYTPAQFPCLHIDPDRRAEGMRTARLEFSAPSVETIDQLLEGRRLVAIKLAPGNPFGDGDDEIRERWGDRLLELEWIGRDRQCRQLVAWLGTAENSELWSGAENHRATILPSHGGPEVRTLVGKPRASIPTAGQLGRFLFDVDSTVLAAKLEGALAEERGLRAAFPGSLYLTSDQPIADDAALECFEVLEILPFDKKRLKRAIAERNWGILEIKKRGATPTPEEVRKFLKLPKNKQAGTLLLAQTEQGVVAVLAKRVAP